MHHSHGDFFAERSKTHSYIQVFIIHLLYSFKTWRNAFKYTQLLGFSEAHSPSGFFTPLHRVQMAGQCVCRHDICVEVGKQRIDLLAMCFRSISYKMPDEQSRILTGSEIFRATNRTCTYIEFSFVENRREGEQGVRLFFIHRNARKIAGKHSILVSTKCWKKDFIGDAESMGIGSDNRVTITFSIIFVFSVISPMTRM